MNRRAMIALHGPNRTGELQLSFQEKIVRRDLTVARAETITPRYRRIVLRGEDLAAGYPLVRFAPSDHVKLYFPDPATGTIRAYRETGPDEWELEPGEGESIHRDYTPRAWDPEAGELTVDFVIHEHGVAGLWARDAAAGDPLTVMGPRANWLLPEDYEHYLALGDETALPAISRLIEEAPAGARVTALLEIADASEEQEIVPADGVAAEVRWVRRDGAPVGPGHRSALETALHGLELPADLSRVYAFAAGEAGAMVPIRRHLRRTLGMTKQQVMVDGYWKRGTADHDHHTNDFDGEDEG
jgi:NADPH-dependent ferric siderophore reductase